MLLVVCREQFVYPIADPHDESWDEEQEEQEEKPEQKNEEEKNSLLDFNF